MKILVFIDNLGAGGAQRQLVGLTRMLADRKYIIEVCTYQNNNFFRENIKSQGIKCVQIGDEFTPRWQLFIMLYKYLKERKPDVVISYLERPSMIACALRMLGLKYKLIVSERNTNTSFSRQDWLRFQMFRIADYVVPNSHSQANFIKEYCPFLSKKIITITNFCSFLEYEPEKRERKSVPEIIVAASIWPPKNTLGFIDAVYILSRKERKFHVSWYGLVDESPYYRECRDKIKHLGLSDYISLLPKTKNLAEKYREADYFCLPSFHEGTPNVLCEALCMSLPSICSNVCDNPIYVKEGINGFLFNPKDPDDMALNIEKLLSLSDEEYQKFSASSRSIAEENLSESIFLEQYIKLL